MGYKHFWYRPTEFPQQTFDPIVADFRRCLPLLEALGAQIAGPYGSGRPVVHRHRIAFNGVANCEKRCMPRLRLVRALSSLVDLGPCPAPRPKFDDPCFKSRECGGHCMDDTFSLDCILDDHDDLTHGGWFWDECETNRKPYDLAFLDAVISGCCQVLPRLSLWQSHTPPDGRCHLHYEDLFGVPVKAQ